MRHDALRLSRRHRWWFYSAFGVLLATGLAWMAVRTWQLNQDPDAAPSPAQPWLMKVHGAAAMLALIVFGSLVPIHIRRGWRAHRNRLSGTVMVTTSALLILTGYALYYAAGEEMRVWSSAAHQVIGVGLPVLTAWHIWRGRRAR